MRYELNLPSIINALWIIFCDHNYNANTYAVFIKFPYLSNVHVIEVMKEK